MTELRYDIFFTGKLVEGTHQSKAIENAAKLFKLSTEDAGKLFTGKPQLLKRRVDKTDALKYKAALHQAGLLTAFKPSNDEPAITRKSATNQPVEASLSLAPAGSDVLREDERRVFTSVDIDTSAIQLRSPFLAPEETYSPPPPEPPNTSHLKLTEVNASLDIATNSPPPKTTIDTNKLSLAPAGAVIETLKTATTPLNPDISSIKLSPLDAGLLTDPAPKAGISPPDISHLSIVKEQ